MHTITERRTTISLSPPSTPRLRMRSCPAGPPRTPLDGGWWPRSTDPVAELPGLILALQAGLQADGPADDHARITHVMLRPDDWDSRPRRLRVDGPAYTRVVRLSWFDTLPAGLLTAIYADGRRVDLLTVPPSTSPAAARSAMELAAHDTNRLPAPKLLAAAGGLLAAAGRTRHTDRTGSHDDQPGHVHHQTPENHRTLGRNPETRGRTAARASGGAPPHNEDRSPIPAGSHASAAGPAEAER
ncbi:hypothetical protein GCM10010191_46430 [Actinomadura vinacea]|uniref:Uncharacterized protein n=1 Tax=Actinomadura vinacea TaxID=115336 RepID=A0ABN3JEE7_9ACTN